MKLRGSLQVAGDANPAGQTNPDQSTYPSNSVPELIKGFNNALMRADQINHMEGKNDILLMTVTGGDAATAALTGLTEERQFT